MKKVFFTSSQIEEIQNTELSYNKAKNFLQCKHCTDQFLGTPLHETMTPKEYGIYEVSNYTFTYPKGLKEDIIVVWCKRCGRHIWDSRNFTSMY